MHTVEAIDSGSLTGLSVVIIVGLVVVGLFLGALIAKFIARLVIALAVVALAVVVWTQRTKVENAFDRQRCDLDTTFFGVHVSPSDDVRDKCGLGG